MSLTVVQVVQVFQVDQVFQVEEGVQVVHQMVEEGEARGQLFDL